MDYKKTNKSYEFFFKGKKITQVGLGLLGRGVGDAEFLAECGAELIVTDIKTTEQLAPSLERLKKFKNIKYSLGGHQMEDFKHRDFILKSAGVPLDSPFIKEAKKNKIPIEMSTSLFLKLLPKNVKTIGVTGTRGKSTTTMMIYEILKRSSLKTESLKERKAKIYLGGNVRDVATLPFLKDVQEGDFIVLELDSWQLQGFGDSKISPNVSVFTTFYQDHMNYYKNDMIAYFADKANIFKYQKKGDVFIVGRQVIEAIKHLGVELPSGATVARIEDFPKGWKLKILGEHNKANAMCAILATRALGVPEKIIKEAIENFDSVPGRLQFMREVKGVKIYNDNNSTTPEATLVALKALQESNSKSEIQNPKQFKNSKKENTKRIILIAGGADKGLDMTKLMEEVNKSCKAVVLLPGTGTEKLRIMNNELGIMVKDLKEAVKKAMELAKKGDVILFSPAFASFGPPPGGFKNEYERNDQFVELVSNL